MAHPRRPGYRHQRSSLVSPSQEVDHILLRLCSVDYVDLHPILIRAQTSGAYELVDKSADATAKRVSEGHDDLASDGDSLSGESEETKVQPQEQTIVYDEHGFIHNDTISTRGRP